MFISAAAWLQYVNAGDGEWGPELLLLQVQLHPPLTVPRRAHALWQLVAGSNPRWPLTLSRYRAARWSILGGISLYATPPWALDGVRVGVRVQVVSRSQADKDKKRTSRQAECWEKGVSTLATGWPRFAD